MNRKTFLIIGRGREGQWWGRFLEKRGHRIMFSSSDEDTKNALHAWSDKIDVIIIAVPMSVCGDVALFISMNARPDQLIISACGLMLPVAAWLAQSKLKNAVLLHRMIGPQVETMKGHPLLYCKVRLQAEWKDFMDELFRELDGKLTQVADHHNDNYVAFTQGMMRVIFLAIGQVLVKKPHLLDFGNVPFDGALLVLKRIIAFGSELSFDMVHHNSFMGDSVREMGAAMVDVREMNKEEFRELFQKVEHLLGPEEVQIGSKILEASLESQERKAEAA